MRKLLAALPLLFAYGLTTPKAVPTSVPPRPPVLPAELVLRGGPVLTVEPAAPVASAIAVRGEKIVYLGDEAGAREYIAGGTRVFPSVATA